MSEATTAVDAIPNDSSTIHSKFHLRLWPGVVIVAVLWLVRIWASIGEMAPSKFFFGLVIAPAAVALALNVWWLLGSRLSWRDRLLVPGVFLAAAAATVAIAGKNFPAVGLILYALPVVSTIWVVWLIVSYKLSWPIRRAGILVAFVAAATCYSLLRVDGMNGSFAANINWRWTPTPEDILLSELKAGSNSSATANSPAVADLILQRGDWPCFRGPQRDSRLSGVRIRTDWDKSPPKEVWRHRVGPGWSSCTVIGERLFTQEQRGDDEFVVCYDAGTGAEIWSHRDTARFEEVVAGAGPRGTPTFHEGRIYALGATGRLNCLNAATGKSYWMADIVKDSSAKVPQWGFSSSPTVFHGLVSVFAGGPEGKTVVAYKIDSGELAWASGEGDLSYCSTHPAIIDGMEQLLIATNVGLTAFEPEKGTVLWQHDWRVDSARVIQPVILSETEILLGTGMNGGTRRLDIHRAGEEWKIQEQWTTKTIKPYYNDLVVMNDHLYGFDGNIFMCVSLADGRMRWRTRGYGNGQVLLLSDEALLLVLSEQGDVALVEAQPEQYKELARIKAIEGKTWNHPTIAHGRLFVRNAEEMACFTIPIETESPDVKVSAIEQAP